MVKKKVLIQICDVVGVKYFISTIDAQKVHNQIVTAFRNDCGVCLSFRDCKYLTGAFVNVAIGQLHDKYSEKFLKDNLFYIDITDDDKKLVDISVGNTKKYMSNKAAYDLAWKQELTNV